MTELKEKLLLSVTQASVTRSGVDLSSLDIHADAIVKLVDAIIKKVEVKEEK